MHKVAAACKQFDQEFTPYLLFVFEALLEVIRTACQSRGTYSYIQSDQSVAAVAAAEKRRRRRRRQKRHGVNGRGWRRHGIEARSLARQRLQTPIRRVREPIEKTKAGRRGAWNEARSPARPAHRARRRHLAKPTLVLIFPSYWLVSVAAFFSFRRPSNLFFPFPPRARLGGRKGEEGRRSEEQQRQLSIFCIRDAPAAYI